MSDYNFDDFYNELKSINFGKDWTEEQWNKLMLELSITQEIYKKNPLITTEEVSKLVKEKLKIRLT